MRPVVTELPELGITAVSWWIFNCYVVHDGGDGRSLVVDAGTPALGRWVGGWLEAHGRGRPVVAATHAHTDHVGGVPHLHGRGVEVVMPPRLEAYLAGEVPRSPGPRAVAKIGPVFGDQPFSLGALVDVARASRHIGFDARGCRFPVPVADWLRDGEPVPGAPAWRVVSVPGHTDDSTALHHHGLGVLLSGDAVLSVQGRAWFTPELVDERAAAETEARLRSLTVAAVLPGHGRPVLGRRVLDHALGRDERPPSRGGTVRRRRGRGL